MSNNGIERTFSSRSSLEQWLENKRWESGTPEAFIEWLNRYFDEGNKITVLGVEYDYWACWELV